MFVIARLPSYVHGVIIQQSFRLGAIFRNYSAIKTLSMVQDKLSVGNIRCT